MKKYWLYMIVLTLGLSACNKGSEPGAGGDDYAELKTTVEAWRQGGGSATKGGSTSTLILHVNTLEDGPQQGTLRYALTVAKPRIVVFDVAGTIYLKSPIDVVSKVTVLGQSAPGQGVCVAGYPVNLMKGAEDVIIRFMRFRLGDLNQTEGEEGDDAFTVNGCTGVMLDHCSFSWSTDEVCSCYGNWNFTMQYCFITEALTKSVHVKGDHGYGGIWGGRNVSFHHNLIAHNDSRNPRFDHDYVAPRSNGPIDYINNVVYNWGGNSTYGGEGSSNSGGGRRINFVNNYYKPGPATKSGVKERLLNPTTTCDHVNKDGTHQGCYPSYGGTIIPAKFFLTGNYMSGSTKVTSDNWEGVFPDEASKKSSCKSAERFVFEHAYTSEQTAEEAYNTVLAKAGCSLSRDALDARIVNDVKNGTCSTTGSNGSSNGLIDSHRDATMNMIAKDENGYPVLDETDTRGLDSDGDGMPDEWEIKFGLNPKSPKDASARTLVTGYTNLEVYLCDLVKNLY